MSDGGFLGESSIVQPQPEVKPAEIPVVKPDEDEVAVAERQAETEMAVEDELLLETPLEGAPTSSVSAAAAATPTQTVVSSQKDEVTLEVEKVLEDGLKPYFQEMPLEAKRRFQTKGTETVTLIADMVRRLKVNAGQVLELIRRWLLTIPGVNKFFLEQEAKIKTDRIVELEQVRRDDLQKT